MKMKLNDNDLCFGDLIKYENGKYVLLKKTETFDYDSERDEFYHLNNRAIGIAEDYLFGINYSEEEQREADDFYNNNFYSIIPKEEEGYVFIDPNSLKVIGNENKRSR